MKETAQGEVTECLPNLCYRIKLDGSEREVVGYASGKIKLNKIKILIGDRVSVELDPYGGNATNRVIRRL